MNKKHERPKNPPEAPARERRARPVPILRGRVGRSEHQRLLVLPGLPTSVEDRHRSRAPIRRLDLPAWDAARVPEGPSAVSVLSPAYEVHRPWLLPAEAGLQ